MITIYIYIYKYSPSPPPPPSPSLSPAPPGEGRCRPQRGLGGEWRGYRSMQSMWMCELEIHVDEKCIAAQRTSNYQMCRFVLGIWWMDKHTMRNWIRFFTYFQAGLGFKTNHSLKFASKLTLLEVVSDYCLLTIAYRRSHTYNYSRDMTWCWYMQQNKSSCITSSASSDRSR